MGILRARVAGQWVDVSGGNDEVYIGADDPIVDNPGVELWYDTDEPAVLSDDMRWNTAWGTTSRIIKTSTEAGYNNTEFGISQFIGLVGATVAGRWSRVNINLIHSAVVQPSVSSYYYITIRLGSGTAGAIVQQFVFPWVPNQQSFGGGANATQVLSFPIQFAAGGLFTVTIQCGGGGLSFSMAASSSVTVEDLGPVTGALPAVTSVGNQYGLESLKPASPATPMEYFASDTKRLWLWDGTGWIIMSEPIQAWTPTWTNLPLGTGGVSTGNYHRSDGYIDFYASATLGTSSAATGIIAVSTPVAFGYHPRMAWNVFFRDASFNDETATHEAVGAGATSIQILGLSVSGTKQAPINTAPNVPFVWMVNDNIQIQGRARMNSKYS